MIRSTRRLAAIVLAALLAPTTFAATFAFRSTDDPGEGFNDPTPFTPVGGNPATTLGAARMNAIVEAGRIWGALLVSNVPIAVDVAFNTLTCGADGTTLGSAGPIFAYRNFSNAPLREALYPSALADALTGVDLNAAASPGTADIRAQFNTGIGVDTSCASALNFYYGFDHSFNRTTQLDFLLVVLHEIGHGLGFASNVNLTTGSGSIGSDGVERFAAYDHNIFDEQANQIWPLLSAAERVQSATRTGSLAWTGPRVTARIGQFTAGVTTNGRVRLYAPSPTASGSSVSHFDNAVIPQVLMRPNLATTIVTSTTDITPCALQDMGWQVTRCPDNPGGNAAPIAANQSLSIAEDTPVVITLTATDANGDPLSFAPASFPTSGTLSAISSTPPRTVTYTPVANFNGNDSFTFTAGDGTVNSAPATVSITITPVNDAPTAAPQNAAVQTGQSVGISLSGADLDGDTVSYELVSNPSSGVLSGTVPNLTYRPNDGFTGTDLFTYRVTDGALKSAIVGVTITVSAPSPAPAAATSNRGGGGALGVTWSVLLALVALRRRLPAQPMTA